MHQRAISTLQGAWWEMWSHGSPSSRAVASGSDAPATMIRRARSYEGPGMSPRTDTPGLGLGLGLIGRLTQRIEITSNDPVGPR